MAQDQSLQAKWGKRKVPMHMLVSWFLEDKVWEGVRRRAKACEGVRRREKA